MINNNCAPEQIKQCLPVRKWTSSHNPKSNINFANSNISLLAVSNHLLSCPPLCWDPDSALIMIHTKKIAQQHWQTTRDVFSLICLIRNHCIFFGDFFFLYLKFRPFVNSTHDSVLIWLVYVLSRFLRSPERWRVHGCNRKCWFISFLISLSRDVPRLLVV